MHDHDYFLNCPIKVVCRCLKVTEAALLEALAALDPKTVEDIRRLTGAGKGCNGCHRILKKYLEQRAQASAEPICSLK